MGKVVILYGFYEMCDFILFYSWNHWLKYINMVTYFLENSQEKKSTIIFIGFFFQFNFSSELFDINSSTYHR